MSSRTLQPRIPPFALTVFAQSLYPCMANLPGSEKSPESEREIPILSGAAAVVRAAAPLVVAAAAASATAAAMAARRAGECFIAQPPSFLRVGWTGIADAVVRQTIRQRAIESRLPERSKESRWHR